MLTNYLLQASFWEVFIYVGTALRKAAGARHQPQAFDDQTSHSASHASTHARDLAQVPARLDQNSHHRIPAPSRLGLGYCNLRLF
jgi:hypothetical protein